MSGSPLFQPAGAALPRSVEPGISITGTGDKDVAINAWRGIAALLVAYFHCRQVTWVGMHEFHRTASGFDLNVLFSYLTFPIAWGSAGVPIFFVISGYCIHRGTARKLLANPAAFFDTRNFLLRRFARIYPVLIAALLLTFALDTISLGFTPVSHKINPVSLHAFVVNLLSLQGVADKTFGSNGALWTLSLEVQFYLVYPLLLMARRWMGMTRLLLCVAVVNLVSGRFLEAHGMVVFTSYWFSWTLGAWIAETKAHAGPQSPRWSIPMQILALVLAALGCVVFARTQYGAFQMWALAFGVYLFRALDKPLRESLAVRGFSRLGDLSFSLYVVHLPIFVLLGSMFFRSALQTSIWPSFAFTAVAAAVASVFYLLVERPAMAWAASFRPRRTV